MHYIQGRYHIHFAVLLFFSFYFNFNIKAQDVSVKGGIGFYTLYESTFYFGKIKISPTPIASVNLTWSLSDLFSLSWENSFRLKIVRSEYIGIDTTTFKSGINFYYEDIFFNIDSKVVGNFSLLKYKGGKLFALLGTGISISLINESDFKSINRNIELRREYYDIREGRDLPEIFYNTGILAEVGVGASLNKISISTNFLIEFFKASLSGAQEINSSLIQLNIIYNF